LNQKKPYFVTVGLADEIEVIRKVKPPRILCSYWYFRNKPLSSFCEKIGYKPEIMLDSGAYSAHTRGKSVNILDYMAYIRNNESFITHYISLDVIQDETLTRAFYAIMRSKGFEPIPVFHHGSDYSMLDEYRESGARYIALGGTVPMSNKAQVAQWCDQLSDRYPDVSFHLLGSCSQKILGCKSVISCDASTWYMRAIKGHPETIPGKTREAKRARAEANMNEIMGVFDDSNISDYHSCF
jgi:hypothetical protein